MTILTFDALTCLLSFLIAIETRVVKYPPFFNAYAVNNFFFQFFLHMTKIWALRVWDPVCYYVCVLLRYFHWTSKICLVSCRICHFLFLDAEHNLVVSFFLCQQSSTNFMHNCGKHIFILNTDINSIVVFSFFIDSACLLRLWEGVSQSLSSYSLLLPQTSFSLPPQFLRPPEASSHRQNAGLLRDWTMSAGAEV